MCCRYLGKQGETWCKHKCIMKRAKRWWETLNIQDGWTGCKTRQGVVRKSLLVWFRWITGVGSFTGNSRCMGKKFHQKLISGTSKLVKRQPFRALGIWFLHSQKGHVMQQGRCRDQTGGISVPSHSSATSKGSPLKNPLAEWQGLLSHLLTSSSALSIWAALLQWTSIAFFSQGQGHLLPLTFGEELPPHSQSRAVSHHKCLLGCMAWYKKAALCLREQGDTGSRKDWLHYTQSSENKMFQLQA